LIAGLAATAAKSLAERIFSPQPKLDPDAANSRPAMIKTQAALARARQSDAFRWGLGATAGATYGALAEYYPEATSRYGANFGLALEALSHEGTIPILGLSAQPQNQSMRGYGTEMASYLAYGVTTELVRRFVRRWL
jgi:putative membrane protein